MGLRFFLLLLVPLLLSGAGTEPEKKDLGFEIFRDNCMACHLQSGMGIREMNAPSIAGLPRWYISDQLRKFRRDQRGFDDEDLAGKLMKANASALDERSIAFVGRHIESLLNNQSRNTLGTPATQEGKTLYDQHCLSCHGESLKGNRSNRVPPLNHQQDWYLLRQLENFSTGKRTHFEGNDLVLTEVENDALVAWVSDYAGAK